MVPRNPEGKSSGREWIPVLLLAAAALLIRLRGLGDFWLNPDEGIFWRVATAPSLKGVWRAGLNEANPPLFYFVIRAVNALSGEPAWLRLPSAAAGTLAAVLAYLLGREFEGEPGSLAGRAAGLSAAAVLAFSPGGVAMSRVIRPYMLTVLLVTAALLFVARYQRLRRVRDLFWHSVFLAGALATHYAAFITLAGLAPVSTALALRVGRRGLAKRLAAAHLLPGAVALVLLSSHVLPVLLGSGMQKACVDGYLKPYMAGRAADAWYLTAGTVGYVFGGKGMWLFLAVIAAGLVAAAGRRNVVAAATPVTVLLSGILLSALGQYPMGCTRHAVHFLPVLALPVAAAAGFLCRRRPGTALAALAAVVSAVVLLNTLDPWQTSGKARLGPLPEMVVSREGFERTRAALEKLVRQPGVLLMDAQTSLVFLPVLRKEATAWRQDGRMRRFEWGRRAVVVASAWQLQGDVGANGALPPLAGFLEEVGRRYPGLPLGTGDVRVVYAGWGWPVVESTRLAGIRAGRSPVVGAAVEGAGSGVFRLRVNRYLEAVRALEKKPERGKADAAPGRRKRG